MNDKKCENCLHYKDCFDYCNDDAGPCSWYKPDKGKILKEGRPR